MILAAMTGIPVTFFYEGHDHKGELTRVSGGGSASVYQLQVDGYYWGQLIYVENQPGYDGKHAVLEGWKFYSNQKELDHLADYFGRVVVAAMEGG